MNLPGAIKVFLHTVVFTTVVLVSGAENRYRRFFLRASSIAIIFVTANMFLLNSAFGQTTYYSRATGNWDGSVWSTTANGTATTATITSSDNVIIQAADNITVNLADAVCKSINMGTNNNIAILTFNSSSSLTVSGTVTLGNPANANQRGSIVMTAGGTLNCQGLALGNAGINIFTPGTGTVELTANNTLPATIFTGFNNLIINGGTTTTAVGLTLTGNLTITSGTFDAKTFTHNIAGDFTNNATFTQGTSTIVFNGTTQTIGGSTSTTFNNLTVSSITSATLDVNTSVAANLNITTGRIFDLSTYTCNRTASGGTLTVAGTMKLGGDTGGQTGSNFPTNFSTMTMTGGTVSYNYAGDQTVYNGVTYVNLIIAGSGTKKLQGNANVSGALTGGGGTTLDLSSYTLGATNAPTSLTLYCGVSGSVISGTGTLTLGGGVTVTQSGSGSNGSTISCPVALGATRTFTVAYNGTSTSASDLAVSGIISSSGAFGITKAGAGKLTLSGTNTYSGTTTVSTGIINIQNNSALGTTAGITTVASGASIQVDGSSLNISEPINTLIGTGISSGGALRNLANSNTWSGAITLGTGGARINSDAGTLTITGGITGSGLALTIGGAGNTTISTAAIATVAGAVTKDGGGTLLFNFANSYTGLTTISAGTLQYGLTGAISTGAVIVADGATYNLNSYSDAIGALTIYSGATGGTVTTGAGTLTLGGNVSSTGGAANASISGNLALGGNRSFTITNVADGLTVSAVISGGFRLTKAGNGKLTLSGANIHSGGTTLSAGTLNINNAGSGGTSSAIGTGTFTISGGTIDNTSGGDITLSTNNAITNTADFSYGGTNNLNLGTGAATLGIGSGATRIITLNGTNSTLTLGGAVRGQTNIAGNGTLTVNGSGNTLVLGSLVTNTNTSARTFTINGSGNTTINGSVSGGATAEVLVYSGSGALTLKGASTYSGGTTLSSGTLNINNAGSGGTSSAIGTGTLSISGGTIDNTSGGSIILSTNNAVTNTGDFIFGGTKDLSLGTGSATLGITSGGTRTITLNGTNSTLTLGGAVRGQTNITGNGTLTVNGSGNTLVLGSLVTNTNTTARTFTINGSGNATINGTVSGGATAEVLVYSGSGALTLKGASTYSGGTTLSSGTLNINNAGSGGTSSAIGTGTFTISGGTIDNTSGGSVTLSTNNTQSWNGDFTFTGTNSLNLGTGTVTMGANRQVTVITNTLTIGGAISAASYDFTKSGAGILALGSNSFAFTTLWITAGKMDLKSVTGNTAATLILGTDVVTAGKWGGTGCGFNVNSTFFANGTGYVTVSTGGTLDHFDISTINSPQTAGTAITGITITAQDVNNNKITSYTGTVTYSGTAGITGTSGLFTLGQLTGVSVTPTVAGTGMTFIVTGSAKTGIATFDVNPGALDHFAISNISSPQTAGTAITGITLTAQDANNNTQTSFVSTVSYSGTAGITGTSSAFTSGVLSGVSVMPITAGTSMTFIVTGSTKTGTATFDVNPGAADATQSTLTPTSASITANGSSTQVLTVQAKDAYGNNLNSGGSTVTITKQSGTGTIGSVTDNSNGTYTAIVTSPTATGSGVFVATLNANPVKSGTGSQTQAIITYLPGALDHFAISSISTPQTAGTAITGITITAQDANNNTQTSFVSTVTYSGTAGITGTSGSFISGQLTGVSVTPITAGNGMTFIVTGSAMTGTATFDVNPGALDHFAISNISSPQTAGTAITGITLTAQDANNNTQSGFTSTVTYSGTAGITGTSGSFTAGQLTGVSITPVTSGTNMTFIVTGSAKTGTATFDVNPGALDHFAISNISSPQTAGTAITGITITAQDANNNTQTSFGSTVSYSGTAGITGTSGTFTSGQLTGVSVTPTVAGSSLTFIVTGGSPGKTGTSIFDVLLPGTWTGATSNNWHTPSNWWSGGVPTSTMDVSIPSGTPFQPVISATAVCNSITINPGATLAISSSNSLTVSGSWTNNGTFTPNTSTVTFNSNVPSTINASTFNNVIINGTGTKTETGDINVNGNLTLNAGTFALNNSTTQTRNLTIAGNYLQSGGVLDFNPTGYGAISTLTIAGDFTNTAGAGSITTVGGGAINGQVVFNGSSTQTITFSNPAASEWTTYLSNTGSIVKFGSNITLKGDYSDPIYYTDFIVNGTIDFGTHVLNDTPYLGNPDASHFTLNSGASLVTANTDGISLSGSTGSVQFNGPRAYNGSANYTYNGASAQVTGNGLTTANNLTSNNSAGLTLSNNVTVTGTLTFTSGLITTGANTLIMGSSGSISGASSSRYINGKLAWIYTTSGGSKTFPIGKGGNYRSLTLNYTTGPDNQSTVTAEQFESTLPGTLPSYTTLFGDRYWSISQAGATTYAFTLTLDGTGFSPVHALDAVMLKGDGIGAYSTNAVTFSSPNYTNTTAFTGFGYFGLAESGKIWTGASSTNWFTSGNWSSNVVPDGSGSIIIPSSLSTYPQISGTSPANDVSILSGGSLSIQTGANLTLQAGPVFTLVSGSTVTTSGTGMIIIETGSKYLNYSSNTPTLQVKNLLANTSKGWRMVAAPVTTTYSDMFKSPLVTQGFTGSSFPTLQPNVLTWDETDGGTTLQAWRQPTNLSNAISSGRGHFFYIFNGAGRLNLDGTPSGSNYTDDLSTSIILSATGSDNSMVSGSYNYTLTRTPRTVKPTPTSTTDSTAYASNTGWNLVGNPTASTLNWDASGAWTKTNTDNTIYIWDPTANSGSGNYLTWNGTTGTLGNGRISPFQAFWVRANAASPALSFTNNAKTATAGTFYKNDQANEVVTVPITLNFDGMTSTSFISLGDNGAIGEDPRDAYRLEPMSKTWLALYMNSSPSDNMPLVINNLPIDVKEEMSIPLYVDAMENSNKAGGSYTLRWEIPDNWPVRLSITLMDHNQKKAISMLDTREFTFTRSAAKSSMAAAVNPLDVPGNLVLPTGQNTGFKSHEDQPFTIVIGLITNINDPGYVDNKPMLLPLAPNPFSDRTLLSFRLPEAAPVRIEVYNMMGQLVDVPVSGEYSAGLTQIDWYPKFSATGTYQVRMTSRNTVQTIKCIKIR